MKKNVRLYDRLASLSSLSGGTVPGVPLIEIISDKRVLLENHQGICRYTHEQICIKTELGIIKLDGKQLHIKQMSSDQLIITGKLENLSICRSSSNG